MCANVLLVERVAIRRGAGEMTYTLSDLAKRAGVSMPTAYAAVMAKSIQAVGTRPRPHCRNSWVYDADAVQTVKEYAKERKR